jgi:hypothetical protein
VKELLKEAKVFEHLTRPRRSTIQSKKKKLENEAIEFSLNLWDKKRQLKVEECSLIELEAKLAEKQ